MANLVDFNANFRWVNLKKLCDLFLKLLYMPTQEWADRHYKGAESWVGKVLGVDEEFIQKVISAVRNTQFMQESSHFLLAKIRNVRFAKNRNVLSW